jgi:hypothetical protein
MKRMVSSIFDRISSLVEVFREVEDYFIILLLMHGFSKMGLSFDFSLGLADGGGSLLSGSVSKLTALSILSIFLALSNFFMKACAYFSSRSYSSPLYA